MSGGTKRIWVWLLAEGGRSSTAEVSAALDIDLADARGFLNSMVAAGSVKRFLPTEPGGFVTFGVTMDCRAPQGLTLRELADMGTVRAVA